MSKEEVDRYKSLVSNLENELKSKGNLFVEHTVYIFSTKFVKMNEILPPLHPIRSN